MLLRSTVITMQKSSINIILPTPHKLIIDITFKKINHKKQVKFIKFFIHSKNNRFCFMFNVDLW